MTAVDNRMLRNIFGSMREIAIERLRRLHNEKLYGLDYSPNQEGQSRPGTQLAWGEEKCI